MQPGPTQPTVEILKRRRGYSGFFQIDIYQLRHRLYNGDMSPPLQRELFERGDAVALLPYDPQRDAVVLIEQFRIGALQAPQGPWLLEMVAGMIEPGETAPEVARREAQEEAGCQIGRIHSIGSFLVSPGGTSERIHLYCGEVDSATAEGVHGVAAEGEDIRVIVAPFSEAWRWLERGVIDSASPIIALQWLQRERSRLQQLWR